MALLVLVVGGTVAAGVAALVATTEATSADRLEGERALMLADSMRILVQGGSAGCDDFPSDSPLTTSSARAYCEPNPDRCPDNQVRFFAWTGSELPAESSTAHSLCALETASSDFDADQDCDSEGYEPDDLPGCFVADGGSHSFQPGGGNAPSDSFAIIGDMELNPGNAYDFSAAEKVCVVGDVVPATPSPQEPGITAQPESFTITGSDERDFIPGDAVNSEADCQSIEGTDPDDVVPELIEADCCSDAFPTEEGGGDWGYMR